MGRQLRIAALDARSLCTSAISVFTNSTRKPHECGCGWRKKPIGVWCGFCDTRFVLGASSEDGGANRDRHVRSSFRVAILVPCCSCIFAEARTAEPMSSWLAESVGSRQGESGQFGYDDFCGFSQTHTCSLTRREVKLPERATVASLTCHGW